MSIKLALIQNSPTLLATAHIIEFQDMTLDNVRELVNSCHKHPENQDIVYEIAYTDEDRQNIINSIMGKIKNEKRSNT